MSFALVTHVEAADVPKQEPSLKKSPSPSKMAETEESGPSLVATGLKYKLNFVLDPPFYCSPSPFPINLVDIFTISRKEVSVGTRRGKRKR